MKITIDSVLVHDEEPRAAELDGGVVVLSMRAGCCFGFNRVASEIWSMLGEPRKVAQIHDSLAQRHEIDAKIFARDVLPFLQTLIRYRLLRVIEADLTR